MDHARSSPHEWYRRAVAPDFVPDADAQEQGEAVVEPEADAVRELRDAPRPIDVPDADAFEQAQEVPLPEEDEHL
jgi:hypothetical protein